MNRGPERPRLSDSALNRKISPNLASFKDFCIVDLQLLESTAKVHSRLVKRFLDTVGKEPNAITKEDFRKYLKPIKQNMAAYTYKNHLAALKRYFRDFLGMESLVKSFR